MLYNTERHSIGDALALANARRNSTQLSALPRANALESVRRRGSSEPNSRGGDSVQQLAPLISNLTCSSEEVSLAAVIDNAEDATFAVSPCHSARAQQTTVLLPT